MSNFCCNYKLIKISRQLSHADLHTTELPRKDLLNCLKKSYYLAVLSLVIFYDMFQIFALSFLQLVSQLKLILVLLRSLWKRSMMQILQNETFSQV